MMEYVVDSEENQFWQQKQKYCQLKKNKKNKRLRQWHYRHVSNYNDPTNMLRDFIAKNFCNNTSWCQKCLEVLPENIYWKKQRVPPKFYSDISCD
jgi:hypothetical protein